MKEEMAERYLNEGFSGGERNAMKSTVTYVRANFCALG